MSLIKSISGIRGTIGGKAGENLTPIDVVKFTSAFATLLKKKGGDSFKIVIGRDARISGEMVSQLVSSTLISLGVDVVDLGLSTTPTVEIAVPAEEAQGGIIITASHNPAEWNALKLLNEKGEFISGAEGVELLEIAESGDIEFEKVFELGTYRKDDTYLEKHIDQILALDLVDVEAIKKRKFKVAIDAVNSTGGIAVPLLLERLGVKDVVKLFCEPNGQFPHNPEPLPENISEIKAVVEHDRCDLGIIVDPDVDRLAFVADTGRTFGEEYTLVSIADYVLSKKKGATVSNLSSTKALQVVTEKHGCRYESSAVGEVNVVEKMKEIGAVIGGEGNGGIILPELHYGRDALVGIALFLTHLTEYGKSAGMLRSTYPEYYIAKNKISLTDDINLDNLLEEMKIKYSNHEMITIDGVKIFFDDSWVHLRKSNTEPIIRIYSEADGQSTAEHLGNKIIQDMNEILSEKV
ncbi:MAG: phosphoglucosamine mutase [Cyclobacteriaceae bacterium]